MVQQLFRKKIHRCVLIIKYRKFNLKYKKFYQENEGSNIIDKQWRQIERIERDKRACIVNRELNHENRTSLPKRIVCTLRCNYGSRYCILARINSCDFR